MGPIASFIAMQSNVGCWGESGNLELMMGPTGLLTAGFRGS
jgi:hypothetical protein